MEFAEMEVEVVAVLRDVYCIVGEHCDIVSVLDSVFTDSCCVLVFEGRGWSSTFNDINILFLMNNIFLFLFP
jgi:hypothetical protein